MFSTGLIEKEVADAIDIWQQASTLGCRIGVLDNTIVCASLKAELENFTPAGVLTPHQLRYGCNSREWDTLFFNIRQLLNPEPDIEAGPVEQEETKSNDKPEEEKK